MENYYTLKQYLLALREEYHRLIKEMETLKEYISFDKKNVKNINFDFVHNPKTDNSLYKYTILCMYEMKRNIIQKQMNNIFKHIGLDLNTASTYTSYYDIDNNTFKKYIYCKTAKIIDKEGFKNEAMNILNSDSLKSLSCNCHIDDVNSYIDISPVNIKLKLDKKNIFNYYLNNDSIHFDNEFNINYNNIDELFNTKIAKDKIPIIAQKAIESSQHKNEEIIFIGNKSFNSFKLCEEDHKILMKTLTKNTTI